MAKAKSKFLFLILLILSLFLSAFSFIGYPVRANAAEVELTTGTGTELDPYVVATEDELATALAAGGHIQLGADLTLATDCKLTVPEGASLTVPEGMTFSAQGGVENNGFIVVNGTLVLPDTMYKSQVLALGITGTGGIKYGNVHIDTEGNCITHNWTEKIRQKDTTCHYTEICTICNTTNEATVASCEYDNACDTNCNICKIVRTIKHTYDANGFCTVCRYSNTPAVDSDGDGLLEIDSAGKLWCFTYEVNGGNRSLNAELTANIDLAGTCGEGIGNWMPIGNEYSGHFNGQGFTVSNIYITGNDQYTGLFGYVKGATIENVTVTGNISSTFGSVMEGYNIFDGAAGGIVAYLDGGTIRNCHVDMTVAGGYNTGGICGYLNDGILENCAANGTVMNHSGSGWSGIPVGGIVGINNGTVRDCVNMATVTNEQFDYSACLGGIAGYNDNILERCTNFGSIIGKYNGQGGIVGNQIWGAVTRGCSNYGTVSGYCTGGIVSDNMGTIENCYNVGAVSGTSNYVAPIANSRGDEAFVTNNYYLSDTTTEDGGRTAAQFASGQVAYELNGKTTAATSVWKQTLGTDSYPTLTGELVYYITRKKCNGTVIEQLYSNSSNDIIVHEDTDSNSFCDLCKWLIITEITFPDEIFRNAILTTAFDKNQDGLLSPYELRSISNIIATNRGVTDLKGIEYFTELWLLRAEGNNLTSLDLSGLTKLERLYCSNNPNLTSLKVSTAIVNINVANTAIRSLDLSECSQLESLDYNNTNLTSLELPAHFLLDAPYDSKISLDIDQKTMVLDLRDFVADVSRITEVSSNATLVGNYLYISEGATQVYYCYDTGAAEGSDTLNVFININNPHTHSFDGNGYCADCGLQAIIRVDVAFNNKYFTTSSFADALALAREGGYTIPAVITLFDDVTVDEAVSLRGGTQILDLNGHTLTFTATNDTPFTLIAETFTIRDSSAAKTGKMYHDVRGNEERTVIALTDSTALVLESGTLDFSRVEAAIAVEDGSIMQQRGGLITTPILLNDGGYELEDGKIETTYPYAFIVDSNGSASYSIEITGGTISVKDTIGYGGLLDFPQNGCDMEQVTITDGTFKNTGGKPFKICVYHSDARFEISGGVFEQGLICTSLWGDDIITLLTVLEAGYAFYDADGKLVALADGQKEIAKYVTVGECTHSFGDYLSDAEGHWHACKVCGATDTKLAHTPEDDDGTCLTALFCSDCFAEVQAAKDDHDFSGAYVYNDNGHWRKCENCEQTQEMEEHYGQSSGDCTKPTLCACGYVVIEAQGHSSVMIFYTDDYHYEGCSTCTQPINDVRTPHNFSVLENDEYGHWYKCSDCEMTSAPLSHVGIAQGDCTQEMICVCGTPVPAEGEHTLKIKREKDDEYHILGCANEGCNYEEDAVHSHSQNPDDQYLVSKATCVSGAVYNWSCECGHASEQTFTVGAPDPDEHIGGKASCTEQAVCDRCGGSYGDLLSHSYTLVQKDEEHHWNQCANCDEVDEKREHVFGGDRVCDECGYEREVKEDSSTVGGGNVRGCFGGVHVGTLSALLIGACLFIKRKEE